MIQMEDMALQGGLDNFNASDLRVGEKWSGGVWQ